jgi:hypothetical protein
MAGEAGEGGPACGGDLLRRTRRHRAVALHGRDTSAIGCAAAGPG